MSLSGCDSIRKYRSICILLHEIAPNNSTRKGLKSSFDRKETGMERWHESLESCELIYSHPPRDTSPWVRGMSFPSHLCHITQWTFLFEAGSHWVAQVDFQLMILLQLLSTRIGCCTSPHLLSQTIFRKDFLCIYIHIYVLVYILYTIIYIYNQTNKMVTYSIEHKAFAFKLVKDHLWTFMILMLPEISRAHPGLVRIAGQGKQSFLFTATQEGRYRYPCQATWEGIGSGK